MTSPLDREQAKLIGEVADDLADDTASAWRTFSRQTEAARRDYERGTDNLEAGDTVGVLRALRQYRKDTESQRRALQSALRKAHTRADQSLEEIEDYYWQLRQGQ